MLSAGQQQPESQAQDDDDSGRPSQSEGECHCQGPKRNGKTMLDASMGIKRKAGKVVLKIRV